MSAGMFTPPAIETRGQARLLPAVENFCLIRGYLFSKVPDQSTGHVGAIDVKFAELSEHATGGWG